MILPSRYTKNIYHSYAGWGSYQFLEFSNELSGKSFKEFFDFSRKIETLSLMHPYNSNIVYDYLVVGPYLTEKLSVDDFQLLNKMEFLAQMANNIEDQWRHSYKPKGSTLNNISIIKELITNEIKVLIKDTEDIYELRVPDNQREKFVTSNVWDYFKYFVGVDKISGVNHIISIGCN